MKFGKYLDSKARPEWRDQYMDYKALKDLIKEASDELASAGYGPDGAGNELSFSPRTTSLTVARAAGRRSADERFYELLESEVAKVNKFTVEHVSGLKKRLKVLNTATAAMRRAAASGGSGGEGEAASPNLARVSASMMEAQPLQSTESLIAEAKAVGDEFLALEKYVNLNYLGFHKILKKHDKNLPHAPCQQFYVAHLHHQPWVQGNYSGLLVQLSSVYSALRGDASGVKNEDASQGFVRSTTKYWVRTADVSAVKHHILQQLPVFQYSAPEGAGAVDAGDAQLVNSAYLDNSSMELYHGRLDKRPGAIAVRIRWYGDGSPKICFMERKTHRESWKGEESVKERFALPEPCVVPFLEGRYTPADAAEDLKAKGKSPEEAAKFQALAEEVWSQIDAKQLTPMIRTQYWRTAFQIPFDSTVRVSLDTNLVMIKENPDDAPTCAESGRWYRDPALPVPRTEITRFPHAVLEVKLSLPEGTEAPAWVTDLLDSGYLTEVHKFSKFIHGTATLMPDLVQAVPYWVDDESVRPSMLQSAPAPSAAAPPLPRLEGGGGGGSSLARGASLTAAAASLTSKPRRRGYDELTHPLLGDAPTLQLLAPRDEVGFGRRRPGETVNGGGSWVGSVLDWWFSSRDRATAALRRATPSSSSNNTMARTVPMRIEPKTFLANERTFLSWLHMAVTIGSIAAALLGFAGSPAAAQHGGGGGGPSHSSAAVLVEVIALILLPVAVLMCAYALVVFVWRSKAIAKKQVGYIDDRFGPLALSWVVIAALSAILVVSMVDFAKSLAPSGPGPDSPPSPPPAPQPIPPVQQPSPSPDQLASAMAGALASVVASARR